jgi:hypothetical protein
MAKTKITYAIKKSKIRSESRTGITSQLAVKFRHPGQREWMDLGVVSERIVTNAMINDLLDVMTSGGAYTGASTLSTVSLANYKFHDSGTGTAAELHVNTALQTPTGEARDSGTQVEFQLASGEATPGQYRTVATHTYAGAFAITEHGVFSASSGPKLLDRSVFAAINVVSLSQIQFTYTLTITGS